MAGGETLTRAAPPAPTGAPEGRAPIMRQFELVERVKSYDPNADEDALNRAYVWVDQDHNVMGRISWTTSNISASPCTGLDTCSCLDPTGLLAGNCQKLVLYLEYPYRLVSGNPVAAATLQTLTLSTIVGRHT